MKSIKTLIILLVISSTSFAKSGLELGIFVPLGMSIGINYFNKPPSNFTKQQTNSYNTYISNNTRTSHVGFEAGVLFQAGYRLEINRDMSFSFMGEFGYILALWENLDITEIHLITDLKMRIQTL